MTTEIGGSSIPTMTDIQRATADYDWEAVVDLVTQALPGAGLLHKEEYEHLRARAKALDSLTEIAAATRDELRMLDIARSLEDESRIVEALNMLAWTQMQAADYEHARAAAQEAYERAEALGSPQLEARALNLLGWSALELNNPQAMESYHRQALAIASNGVSPKDEVWALREMRLFPSLKSDRQRIADCLSRSLELARASGDRLGELIVLNVMGNREIELNRNYQRRREAFNVAKMIDNRGNISILNNNLAWSYYWRLGLYRQSIAYAEEAVRHQRRSGFHRALYYSLDTLAFAAHGAGDFDLARAALTELIEGDADKQPRAYYHGLAGLGRLLLDEGCVTEAIRYFRDALAGLDDARSREIRAFTLSGLAAAYLAGGQPERALTASEKALSIVVQEDFKRYAYPLQDIWWQRFQVLSQLPVHDPWLALDQARKELFEPIATMGDEGLRRNFLNKPITNRSIGETWAREAVRRGLSLSPLTERETTPAALAEQLQRIVDSGARLAGERDTKTLAEFIVQEFVELSGVERVVLATRSGGNRNEPLRWAATEGIAADRQQVEFFSAPFIEQAALTRAPVLAASADDVPEGELPELHLRSVLALPLVSQGRLWGVLYGDMRHLFGRLNKNDRDILSLLANQAGAALENADWVDTLEQQVMQRTAEAEGARKAAESARTEAERANKAKSAFMSNMSHELRTPLNAIIGFTRIVQRKTRGQIEAKQTTNLDKVLASGEHLLGLINTVLDIAKIEAGRMDVITSTFTVGPLINACTALTQPLLKPGVGLFSEIEANLPPITSDQDKVKQILLNLLSNAAKFTHDGSITIRACLAATAAPPQLEIDVIDTGIGMTPQALDRIFEEFQQAERTTARDYGGTGLGLPISKHLAQLLGGDLTAESREGAGSTFRLILPLQYEISGIH